MTALALFGDPFDWTVRRRTDPAANALADRHYSRRRPGVGRVAGPWAAIVLVTADELAAWVTGNPQFPDDGLDAWRCTLFRNEGPELSSRLIVAAMARTLELWRDEPRPADGWATYVDRSKIEQRGAPGYCFLAAGWWRDRSYEPDRRRRSLIRLRASI